MHFFLSSETYGMASSFLHPIEIEFSERLLSLEETSYGEELTSIAIIAIILPSEFYSDGGYKERRLFHRKTRDADIRLRIDYHSFVYAKPPRRRELYAENVINSILTLKKKVSSAFQFDRLLSDVAAALGLDVTAYPQYTEQNTGDGSLCSSDT